MTLGGWSGLLDTDSNAWSFLHTGGALNMARYSNPQVDELLDHPNLPTFLDRGRCRAFISRFRQGVQLSPDIEAHTFGCLASVCFTAKYDV